MDLILSSGYLAFARHLGALDALEEAPQVVDAVVGTSSGALVGALWLAGLPPEAIAQLLTAEAPLRWLSLSRTPWRGLFDTSRVANLLGSHLPSRFSELRAPFAVGVVDERGTHRLLTEGPLLPAVLASFAIPRLLSPQRIGGAWYWDGGVADRAGVSAWLRWRPGNAGVLHLVERTRGRNPESMPEEVVVVQTPRARASLWSLKDFRAQRQEARRLVGQQLALRRD